MFVENILSSKPAEVYLREINKQPNKWQKVLQNNDILLTEINSLLNYS